MSLLNANNYLDDGDLIKENKKLAKLIAEIEEKLLPNLEISSINPNHPVIVTRVPKDWHILGRGNYAGVFYHQDYDDIAVKIYAPGREGWAEEVDVYKRLGDHPAFSKCFYAQNNFLVLKRLYGITLYDSLHQGWKIPRQVIKEIDLALEYARSRGLFPHDIHGRNAMMLDGKGLVVDISDFLKTEPCLAWSDLKIAYNWLYVPLLSWHRLPLPYFILDLVRFVYRLWRRWRQVINISR